MTRQDAEVAVAAAVVVHEGRVLVQTRPTGAHYEGHWEFPGGKREPGESAAACAVRECAEELRLDVRAAGELVVVRWGYTRRRVVVTFVECELVDPCAVPDPQDGQRARWAGAADLDALTFLPANERVLELLRPRLSS